ncbi:MAG: DNA topoisomerase, partial [Candidatus Marinimicrobia bacterium]|nr:DNA topoisomerase [Candidatus Neomarinimicrobiota bacterium]
MTKRSLIIVESPSKARTIERYLGKEYRVEASNGHIKDLPAKKFGVDVTDNFKAEYVVMPGKAKIIKKLKERAEKVENIYLATDPDREGEAIAWHIATEVNGSSKNTRRVLFNEITPEGLKEGMANPHDVNMNLVNAQITRRIIDRIVGYTVSPFLGSVLYRGLSAGRVQSVALRIVCERHEEIINFKPQEYWTLDVELITEKQETFTARLHHVAGKKPEISSEADMQKIVDAVRNQDFVVSEVKKKDVRKSPPPPFTTSTLQQDAASRLRLTPRRSMSIAQRLYEGVDIGGGEPTGLITYMRTDSTRVSASAVKSARNFLSSEYGNEFIPSKPNI